MNRTLPTTAAVAIAALSLTACKKAELMAPRPAKPPPAASSDAKASSAQSSQDAWDWLSRAQLAGGF